MVPVFLMQCKDGGVMHILGLAPGAAIPKALQQINFQSIMVELNAEVCNSIAIMIGRVVAFCGAFGPFNVCFHF